MIKSRLTKKIIFGLIFSIIFGFMGNYLYNKIKLEDNIAWLNKFYVLEIAKNENLNKFRNIGIFNHNNFISNKFFSSLRYNLLIFKKINNINVCQSISVVSSDLSILIESGSYAENKDELVTSCLTDIISKSFKRFKENIIFVVEGEILLKQLTLKRLKLELLEKEKNINRLKKKKKIVELKKKENLLEKGRILIELEKIRLIEMNKKKGENSSIYEFENFLCDNIDILFKNAITNLNIYLKNDKEKDNKVENPKFIGKFLSLDYLISLGKECNRDIRTLKLDDDVIKSELEVLNLDNDIARLEEVYSQINTDMASQISEAEINEINNQINEIQKFISYSKLENIFHLQKNTVKVKKAIKKELYLTRTQTLITFSVLGFIVGFILGSNFLAVLKENK